MEAKRALVIQALLALAAAQTVYALTPPPIWEKLQTGAWYEQVRLAAFGVGMLLSAMGLFLRGFAFFSGLAGKETGELSLTSMKLFYGGIALIVAIALLSWFIGWLAGVLGYTPSKPGHPIFG